MNRLQKKISDRILQGITLTPIQTIADTISADIMIDFLEIINEMYRKEGFVNFDEMRGYNLALNNLVEKLR